MTANTNTSSESTAQTTQFSFNGTKSGAALASLANATEPSAVNFSFKQQTSPVATFPQKTTSTNSPTVFTNNWI